MPLFLRNIPKGFLKEVLEGFYKGYWSLWVSGSTAWSLRFQEFGFRV